MAIDLTQRPDLEKQVERLAAQMGLSGQGRKTEVIEQALKALEDQVGNFPSRSEIRDSLNQFLENGPQLREEVLRQRPDLKEPLSETLQDELYDAWGLPR